MTEQTIGTARLDLVVNTENAEAGIARAKRSLEGFSGSAQQQYQSLTAAERRYVDSLNKQIDTMNLSKQGRLAYIATLKTQGAVQQELLARIKATEAAEAAAGKTLNQYGLSAKQTAAALRQVPAQLTDIVTGLATGQRPLNVLLQQGGQLKDVFGGVVPAARALGGALLGLINPYTLTAGAIALVAYAAKQASDEQDAFTKALVTSGAAASLSAGDLTALARKIDQTSNATSGQASDVLAQVAATGKFTADQLETVTRAALAMQDATGKAVEDTVAEFASLKGDPVQAILKLNEAQHFLTQETLDQIESLQKQGRQADAAALAIKTYADTLNERAPQITQHLSQFEQVWRAIKQDTREAYDEIVEGTRRAEPYMARLLKLQAGLTGFTPQSFALEYLGNKFDAADAAKASAAASSSGPSRRGNGRAARNIVDSAQAEAALEFDRQGLQYATQRARLEKAIADARAQGTKAGKSEADIDARIAQIRKSFADKDKSGQAIADATLRSQLDGFKQQLEVQTNALTNAKKVVEERFKSGLISLDDYYKELGRIAGDTEKVQLDAIDKQIAALNAQKATGKGAIDNARQIADLQAQAAKIRANAATEQEVLDLNEKRAIEEKTAAIKAYKDALDESNDALQADMQARVASITMGKREFELQQEIAKALKERAARERELAIELQKGQRGESGGITKEQYDADLRALEDYSARRLEIIRNGFDAENKAREDWSNGARAAFKDFEDQANDAAGAAYDLLSKAFDGAADALTNFITKGKGDFKGLIDSLAADLLKFEIKKQLVSVAKKFFPGLGGGDADQATALSKSATELTASGATLITAAAALSASAAALAAAGVASGASGAAGGGGEAGGLANLASTALNLFFSAKGNVFNHSDQVQAFAAGGVVNRATMFRMRSGLGVMGEAGPEAILPLRRGSDGRLGVQIADGGLGGSTSVAQNFYLEGYLDRKTTTQLSAKSGRAAQQALSRRRA